MSKLTKSEVLYMEIPKGPLACGNCMMWIKDVDRCMIHPKDTKVTGDMICGLYVNGKPSISDEAESEGYVTATMSGLGKGRTNCGNCRWGVDSYCVHPMLKGWPVHMQNGCCNAWTEKTEAEEGLEAWLIRLLRES